MKLSPAILAALEKVDAAHAEFFAVLDREARGDRRSAKRKRRVLPFAGSLSERRHRAEGRARRGSLKRAAPPLRRRRRDEEQGSDGPRRPRSPKATTVGVG